MATGTIKWFNYSKGYGFIEPTDKSNDVFLHISELQKSNIMRVQEGQQISYQVSLDRGKESAIDIKLI